jgi:GntR family transcriptional regulator
MIPMRAPEIVLEGGDPISRQIHDQIRDLILAGCLQPGEQLPTVRTMAVGLAVTPRVVTHAYAHLEREGYVCAGDTGSFYATLPKGAWRAEPPGTLEELCRMFVAEAACRGYLAEDVLTTVAALTGRRVPS